ncbi:MAG TPA: 3-oxoacid CoA-transferase subunit B [Paenibacillaceae bacterium]
MADLSVSDRIAKRAARELRDGDVVNLGIGIPTRVIEFVPDDLNIHVHTENGMLEVGPSPAADKVDPNLVNAGKLPVTEKIGASYFHSADSFAMIRGGHIDVAILGALQVDEQGRIANWAIPGQTVLGVGGAMDLLVGARKIIVTTTHTTKKGEPKIVDRCTYPITGDRPADLIITDLCVFRCENGRLILTELAPGVTLEQVKANTTARFEVAVGENAGERK